MALSVIAAPAVQAEVGGDAPVGEAVPSSDPVLQASLEASRAEDDVGANAEASRLAYRDQSTAEALETARDIYPELLLAPAWRPLTLVDGSEVESYLGPHTARVDLPGHEGDALVESVFPLRAPSESGRLDPVDLALVDQGQVIAPKNPLGPLRIDPDLGGGAELPRAGLGFRPTGFEQNSAGQVVEDKAFYANAYPDTDYILRALPAGVEALFQLRSIDSPDRFSLRFDLPAGASLEKQGERGAAIANGDDVLARIPAPVASDADGRQIPITFDAAGDELRLSIDHAAGSWTYPILVDPPVMEEYRYWSNWSVPDYTGWQSTTRPASGFVNTFSDSGWGGDLQTWGRGIYTYGSQGWQEFWDWATWAFDSPGREAFVYKGEFSYVSFVPGDCQHHTDCYRFPPGRMNAAAGIRTQDGWWESGVVLETGQASPLVYGNSTVSYQTTTHCLAGGCQPTGSPNNQMALHTYS
ncbi:MAG: hypothetical protein ACRDL6_05555, partial [Solirubrobacterales bacterium]